MQGGYPQKIDFFWNSINYLWIFKVSHHRSLFASVDSTHFIWANSIQSYLARSYTCIHCSLGNSARLGERESALGCDHKMREWITDTNRYSYLILQTCPSTMAQTYSKAKLQFLSIIQGLKDMEILNFSTVCTTQMLQCKYSLKTTIIWNIITTCSHRPHSILLNVDYVLPLLCVVEKQQAASKQWYNTTCSWAPQPPPWQGLCNKGWNNSLYCAQHLKLVLKRELQILMCSIVHNSGALHTMAIALAREDKRFQWFDLVENKSLSVGVRS